MIKLNKITEIKNTTYFDRDNKSLPEAFIMRLMISTRNIYNICMTIRKTWAR